MDIFELIDCPYNGADETGNLWNHFHNIFELEIFRCEMFTANDAVNSKKFWNVWKALQVPYFCLTTQVLHLLRQFEVSLAALLICQVRVLHLA
jgi:hypothetical protein